MCGIVGLLLGNPEYLAMGELYEALALLQHRGQDAAGIVTCSKNGRFYQCKGNGMVKEVFSSLEDGKKVLFGSMGIGHVRYPTAGGSSDSEAQPFYVNSPYGIVLGHNGNLTNSEELRHFLDQIVHRHLNTDSDSEVLLNIWAHYLNECHHQCISESDICTSLSHLFKQVKGAYTCVSTVSNYGIIAFRDPYGIRPLVVGTRQGKNTDYMIASESCALDSLGFTQFEDVQPGQVVIITRDNGIVKHQITPHRQPSPCIFEYVYFARPDSIIDKINLYQARFAMGAALAKRISAMLENGIIDHIDVIIPVPDTSRTAAQQLSTDLSIPLKEGFIKNRYIGRTFIMPGQPKRRQSVRRKLHPMASEFQGKNVLIVDDSIVRGTTSFEIIQMARDAGAKKVYMASCAPPVRYPNVYGIDMPSFEELVAYDKTEEQIITLLGADNIIYQTLPDLIESCSMFNPDIKEFEDSVFSGRYITGDVSNSLLQSMSLGRQETQNRKMKQELADIIGLHNI